MTASEKEKLEDTKNALLTNCHHYNLSIVDVIEVLNAKDEEELKKIVKDATKK